MLLKLHGTSGSGKSTIARNLMNNGMIEVLPNAYRVDFKDWRKPLFILGTYTSQCGGCDTLTASEQIALIHKYAPEGHVFYEGLLGSEYYGKLGQASEQYGNGHIFAFLDTPIEVCVQRVKDRRLQKGNTKPFNEDNTRNRVAKIDRLYSKLLHSNRQVCIVPHQIATDFIFDLFRRHDDAQS